MLIGIDASRGNRLHKSGTEWYSYHLIRQLSRIDRENQYILYTNQPLRRGMVDLAIDKSECDIEDRAPVFDADGFQVLSSTFGNFKGKVLNWPFHYFWTQGRLSWEMLVNRPDVLFVPAHTLPFFLPKKSLNTIHDIGFERDRQLYQNTAMGPAGSRRRYLVNAFVRLFTGGKYGANSLDYLHWSTMFALKHSTRIITVSDFSRQEISAIYGEEFAAKIRVVHNGYDRNLYHPRIEPEKIAEVRERYGLEEPYVLYVGRLERKKNTPALIESFAVAKEKDAGFKHQLLLIGDASFGYDEVKYLIREYNLDDDVIMPGWVEERDLPCVFRAASAFVFPTLYEGFGIPVLQAMACGTPVAASNTASIPEVAGDAVLYFNPANVISMADAILNICQNQVLREACINKGLERSENFSWEKCAQETLKTINEMNK